MMPIDRVVRPFKKAVQGNQVVPDYFSHVFPLSGNTLLSQASFTCP
jgi:hypothetical protein